MAQIPEFRATTIEVVERRYSMIQCYQKKEMMVKDILDKFKVTSPDFYKYLGRFNLYGKVGLQHIKRGSKVPHNRISNKEELNLMSLHEKYPYFSSYEFKELTGLNPRTIQRICKRNNLRKTHLPKLKKKKILEKLKKELLRRKREEKSGRES